MKKLIIVLIGLGLIFSAVELVGADPGGASAQQPEGLRRAKRRAKKKAYEKALRIYDDYIVSGAVETISATPLIPGLPEPLEPIPEPPLPEPPEPPEPPKPPELEAPKPPKLEPDADDDAPR